MSVKMDGRGNETSYSFVIYQHHPNHSCISFIVLVSAVNLMSCRILG